MPDFDNWFDKAVASAGKQIATLDDQALRAGATGALSDFVAMKPEIVWLGEDAFKQIVALMAADKRDTARRVFLEKLKGASLDDIFAVSSASSDALVEQKKIEIEREEKWLRFAEKFAEIVFRYGLPFLLRML